MSCGTVLRKDAFWKDFAAIALSVGFPRWSPPKKVLSRLGTTHETIKTCKWTRRGGFGSQSVADLLESSENPSQHCGNCGNTHHSKGRLPGLGKASERPPAACPPNDHFHLLVEDLLGHYLKLSYPQQQIITKVVP